jgi:hypothetical protein
MEGWGDVVGVYCVALRVSLQLHTQMPKQMVMGILWFVRFDGIVDVSVAPLTIPSRIELFFNALETNFATY